MCSTKRLSTKTTASEPLENREDMNANREEMVKDCPTCMYFQATLWRDKVIHTKCYGNL